MSDEYFYGYKIVINDTIPKTPKIAFDTRVHNSSFVKDFNEYLLNRFGIKEYEWFTGEDIVVMSSSAYEVFKKTYSK